ncbi:MAG: uroporphyrinogen-III C-methyltransferase [bacterium]
MKNKKGIVYLIGAGPGDPKLITLRGKECIQAADVLIYDYLANPVFLSWAKPEAEILYVGKKGGTPHIQQEEINELILRKVEAGAKVARLKGGDPFIFGRGGEEAEVLADEGIPFEIVPGITSAISVPAYAGIPLTHRQFTSTVSFITGHEDPNKEESSLDWEKISTGAGTLVFLMSMTRLSNIVERLQKHGLPPATPVAVIQWGTSPSQRTLVADLQSITDRVAEKGFGAPSIIVVGQVVSLREKLQWFEKKPLFGKTIVVTRARAQSSAFSQNLTELGALSIEFPTIRVSGLQDSSLLDDAIQALSDYQWIIFTSVNGVDFFFQRLHALKKDSRAFGAGRVCAIGPETASALRQQGIIPDYVPFEYRAESIIEGFSNMGIKEGVRILIPRALEARDVLPEQLAQKGARISVVPVYETLPDSADSASLLDLIQKKAVNMVTFTSTSTVKNFCAAFSGSGFSLPELLEGVDIACIGPICAREAQVMGLKVHIIPKEYTIAAMTESIVTYYQNPKKAF